MPGDYIPKRDSEFNTWISNFQTYVAAHAVELGLTPAQALEVLNAKTMWGLSYTNHIAAREAAGNAQATKEEKKGDATKTVRQIVALIQARKETTDGQRRSLAITVPDRVPTPTDPEAIRRISPPEMELDYSKPQQVTVYAGPYPKDERRNGFQKPATGFELEVLYSAVPSGTENLESLPWQHLANCPHSPYLHIIGHAATVTYRARYFDQLSNVGPWGPPESCSVTA
jgi:hypothetical protein